MSSTSNNSPQRNHNYKKIFAFILILFFGGFTGFTLLYLNRVKRIINHQKFQILWDENGTIDLDEIDSDEYEFLPVEFRRSFKKIKNNISRFTHTFVDNPIVISEDCKDIIDNYNNSLDKENIPTIWRKSRRLHENTDLNFEHAIYIIFENNTSENKTSENNKRIERIEFKHSECKKDNLYSSFFKHIVLNVAIDVAKELSSKKESEDKENSLYVFSSYSDSVKNNILLQDKSTEQLWKNIKVGFIYMIKDIDENTKDIEDDKIREIIFYPKHDFNSFKEYNYQSRPWFQSIKEDSYKFGITAPYQNNEAGNNSSLVRTLWYKFNDDNNKSYILLFDLFIDSSDILDLYEDPILKIDNSVIVLLVLLIFFIVFTQIDFNQIDINWQLFNKILKDNTEKTINKILEIIHGNKNRN